MKKSKTPKAGAGSAPRSCWPLPQEWDTFIPPQPVHIIEFDTIPGIQHSPKGTRPAWNDQWLRGLEAYVRSIVRDELRKANPALTVPPLSADTVGRVVLPPDSENKSERK